MRRRRRHRLRIALLAIVCLLCQQVALAAGLCAWIAAPVIPVAMAGACDGMAMPAEHSLPCASHCAPEASLTASMALPAVPALALPPLRSLVVAAIVVPSGADRAPHLRPGDPDPPPRLRYCSLLI